jgi:hypothetical protein
MNEVRNDELLRLSLKPALTPDDETRLELFFAAHPEERLAWEEERALGRALQSLPDVPISSNFTALVMQAVELEEAREERLQSNRHRWLHGFWPRLGWTAVAALFAVLGAQQYRTANRNRLAHDVAFVSQDVTKLPSAEVLQDFDAIDELRRLPSASDDELLMALR